MKKPLYIYGAGGLGKEVLSLIRTLEEWDPVGFIDDSLPSGSYCNGLKIVGGKNVLSQITSSNIIIAVGDPLVKKKISQDISGHHLSPIIVHPSAIIQDPSSVSIGAGSILCARTVLTCDIRIGEHVLLNLSCTVGHDVRIDSYCSVMPGSNIAGNVLIGSGALLGSGCNIRNNVSIGPGAVVGMGAVVLNDVASGHTVVGVPAKPLKTSHV